MEQDLLTLAEMLEGAEGAGGVLGDDEVATN